MADTYVGAEQVLVDLFVTDRLASQAAALEAISSGLSTRIHLDYAPSDEKYPFIIYQAQTPPRDVRGVGLVRVMVDTLYLVKAVAQVDSYAPLAPLAKVIDTAMTSDSVTVEDGIVLASVRQDQFSLVEIDGGKQYRHLGGQYQIHAQAHQ